MNLEKKKQFDLLIKEMSNCSKCLNLKNNKSLVNLYQTEEVAKNIPSIWTDWYSRLDANLMIIGQDWGPFQDMEKLNKMYLENKVEDNWNILIETEKSTTKKMLTKYLNIASDNRIKDLNNIYITNAIMCARSGSTYRGNNINLKLSTTNCSCFLKRQIEIVKPKVIATLGYYPLLSLSLIFQFDIADTLSECIKSTPIIKVNDLVIIPLYHPVAQIRQEEQLIQYKKIWQELMNLSIR